MNLIAFLLALAIVIAPGAAESQNAAARIGLLGPDEEPRFSEIASGLKRGLQEQGYRESMVHVVEARVRRGDEAAARATVGIPGGFTSGHHETMIAAANSKRLPTVFYTRTRSTRDALLTYGASDVDVARQAARILDKILKGANAGELAVERPTQLTLVVNLKTAQAMGLTISPALRLRADRIIE